ncbi:hypothetical protein ACFVYR_33455 [Streptomyces sp. NPDC058284]|uniref:hypothetical protein n=1 Tax=unclassified Streptomyces TaxID=2593676 RepID=UPI003647766D
MTSSGGLKRPDKHQVTFSAPDRFTITGNGMDIAGAWKYLDWEAHKHGGNQYGRRLLVLTARDGSTIHGEVQECQTWCTGRVINVSLDRGPKDWPTEYIIATRPKAEPCPW